ncbi:hypothetical protein N7451_009076 [Penicillium sp. IBT 35674x]|nr:hypothetical protein N7451_009076 [Penicillium sp. IBT 35674x]
MQFITVFIATLAAVASASPFHREALMRRQWTTMLHASLAVTPAAMAGSALVPLSGTPVFAFPTTKAAGEWI